MTNVNNVQLLLDVQYVKEQVGKAHQEFYLHVYAQLIFIMMTSPIMMNVKVNNFICSIFLFSTYFY